MSGRLSPQSTARGRAWCRSEARDAAVSSMPEARAGSASVARPGSRGECMVVGMVWRKIDQC